MYARIARYEVPPDGLEKAIDGFRESGAGLQQLEGLVGGYLLVHQDSGRTVTITLWDNHANMEGSATRAATLRQRALQRGRWLGRLRRGVPGRPRVRRPDARRA